MPYIGINAYIYGAFVSTLAAAIPAVAISQKYFKIKRAILKYYIICGICALFSATVSKYIPYINLYERMAFMLFVYCLGLLFTGIMSEITGIKRH